LTEFLPISSSAHLILLPWFLGWRPEGLAFDVSLHLGTAAAVLAYFWRDWIRLAVEAVKGVIGMDLVGNQDRRLACFLVLGSIPAALVGLLFEREVEQTLRSPLIIVITLPVFGLLLAVAERRSRLQRGLSEYTWSDAVWIGLSQAVALVPGVSRSGITMTAALLRHAQRASAARFSFLLATPIILGAALREGWGLLAGGMQGANVAVLLAGTASAAITGFFCIGMFLRYLQARTFTPFVIYRILLAAVVLVYYLRGAGQ
jgi:undecaprenyl-diphosphatase